MAERRMFSKSVTNSSAFLRMPMSTRLLYYDLGMNADDDGFVEHFMVLRITGASQQDLGVLELNGLIKVLDDNVLWIKDWKENNYIRKDRYTPSKYLSVYHLDTIGIPLVDAGKDRLGKDRLELGKDSIDNKLSAPSSDEPDLEPFVLLPLIDKTHYPIYQHNLDKWQDIYPAVNIQQEFRNMLGWLDSHPKNRKTKGGINRFINGWLGRCQDKARVEPVERNSTPTSNKKTYDPNDIETWDDEAILAYVNGGASR